MENILGERLKQLREETELTQESFGKQFNLAKSTVSQYESGISRPDDALKIKIALHHKVSLDWLMGLTDIRNNSPEELRYRNLLTIIRTLTPESLQDLLKYVETLRIRDIAKANIGKFYNKLSKDEQKALEKFKKP